jgi:hypothetical protein
VPGPVAAPAAGQAVHGRRDVARGGGGGAHHPVLPGGGTPPAGGRRVAHPDDSGGGGASPPALAWGRRRGRWGRQPAEAAGGATSWRGDLWSVRRLASAAGSGVGLVVMSSSCCARRGLTIGRHPDIYPDPAIV